MKGYYKISFIILLTIFILFGYSQDQEYQFEHITTEQGLSHNMTKSIIQDSKGFIWIGTNRGLNRYDGNKFKNYINTEDSTSLSGVVITDIYEDNEGNIWVGTRWSGLNKYNRAQDNFTHYKTDPEDSTSLSLDHVKSICQDKKGTIWVGTFGGGLNKFDSQSETFTVYKQSNGQTDYVDRIYDVYEDDKGTLWIATEAGLFTFDREKEKFSSFDLNLNIPSLWKVFQCIYQDANNVLWFGSYHGLIRYDISSKKATRQLLQGIATPDNESDGVIECITESKSGSDYFLWIGTRNSGLYKLDIKKSKTTQIISDLKEPFSLSENIITNLFIDNTNNLWIATRNSGLDKLNLQGNPFKHYILRSEPDDVQYAGSTFLLDKKGNLWVGAYHRGLFKFDKKMNILSHYEPNFYVPFRSDSIRTNYVSCLFEDSKNRLWVSFERLGLTIFDTIQKKFIPIYGIPNINDTLPIQIYHIIEDERGRIWFGDIYKGLYLKEPLDDLFFPLRKVKHEQLSKAKIRDIFKDSKGNIWIGTFKSGLFCLEANNRESMTFIHSQNQEIDSNGYYGTYVNSFCEDHQGNLWITTSKGLNKFDPVNNKFIVFKQHKELYGDQIMKIFADDQGNLWFNQYQNQLVRFNPNDTIQNPIKVFGTLDGLPFSDFSYEGLYQAHDGRIFIGGTKGTNNGFFSFYPDSVQDNKQIPVLAITDFKVRNKIYPLDSNITEIKHLDLKYNENFFSFEFAALDYTHPSKNQYAYFLEGLEEDWINSGNRRFASYTGVPPGSYTLHIKGSNNDGYWNETGISIAIKILPPPWKTWWAYSIYFIILLVIIYAWRRYDLKRQRLKQQLEIEQVEALKLKELDTMKSRFFANISHEFRTPLTLILGPLQNLLSKSSDGKENQDLNIMQRNALRLKTLIDQLLNLSKLESGKMKLQASEENIVALVNGYVQSFESLARQKKVDLKFESIESDISIFVDRDKIEKILYNLLSNAFKFTGKGGEIVVEITPPSPSFRGGNQRTTFSPLEGGQRGVEIKISDTGRGISPKKLEHIFDRFYQADDSYTKDQEGTGIGLALTKELVDLHYGKILAESVVGKGSVFSIILPKGKEHLKPEEIVKDKIQIEREEIFEPIPPLDHSENYSKFNNHKTKVENNEKPLLLIVDDNDDLRIYMKDYLDKDYYIFEAIDGKEGFDKATEKIPDLIISDVMMPIMDGYELCEKLKFDERTSHIPVILLTARASFESKIEGLETGADDFITKPFDPLELQTRVRNLIKQRLLLREIFASEIKKGQLSLPGSMSLSRMTGMDQLFIQKTWDVAEQHFSDPEFNVESFSQEMAISRVHLHRKLKALIDHTASEFLRTYRLNKAAEKLTNKEATVSEIAYDVGFSTVQYFSKCFFDQFGISPTEYSDKR